MNPDNHRFSTNLISQVPGGAISANHGYSYSLSTSMESTGMNFNLVSNGNNNNNNRNLANYNDQGYVETNSLRNFQERSLIVNALLEFDVEMERLPISMRQAYTEAKYICPHLIGLESNPLHWILYEQFNLRNAVQGLATHWEWRKRILGPERAYLPIFDLSGSGALSEPVLHRMRLGCFVPLPSKSSTGNDGDNNTTTSSNRGARHVFFADRSRGLGCELSTVEQSLALPFYFFTRLLTLDCFNASTDSVLSIDLLSFVPAKRIGMAFYNMASESFPFRLEPSIITVPYNKKRTYFQQMLPIIMKRVGQKLHPKVFTVYIGESKLDIQRKFEAISLGRDCLPTSVGGTWKYDQYDHWFLEESNKTTNANSCSVDPTTAAAQLEKNGRVIDTDLMNKDYLSTKVPKSSPMKKKSVNLENLKIQDDSEERCRVQNTLTTLTISSDTSLSSNPRSSAQNVNDCKENSTLNKIYDDDDHIVLLATAMKNVSWMQKGVYAEAAERCPDLIAKESDPKLFIMGCNGDAALAAIKLASYWQQRKEILGPEMAFHRIADWMSLNDASTGSANTTITGGGGAITFCHESCSILPNSINGCQVLYYEPSSSLPSLSSSSNTTTETEQRTLFTNLARLLCNPASVSTTNGVILLLVLREDDDDVQLCDTILSEKKFVFPIHFAAIHVVVKSSYDVNVASGRGMDYVKVDSRLQSTILSRSRYYEFIHFHAVSTNSIADVIHSLEPFGFHVNNIPVRLGGRYSTNNSIEWEKIKVEHSVSVTDQKNFPPYIGKHEEQKKRPFGSGNDDHQDFVPVVDSINNNDENPSSALLFRSLYNGQGGKRRSVNKKPFNNNNNSQIACTTITNDSTVGIEENINTTTNKNDTSEKTKNNNSNNHRGLKNLCQEAYLQYVGKISRQQKEK